ncbi:hypothetical protein GEV33_006934 [Tenebrio molitor]|uniref:Uncharacterized protein n=1 Tax=Tenebrio molitor TaxID=7067 RepID=A0A8J6LCS1_TENMO|nr:hypothetical protein GEV33_006934 [Tenebrio molitor]
MAGFSKITPLFLLLLLCKKTISAESESKEELVQSESKDGKLEIIKQIKKVNDDGSYTIGYEADDGSFKIESRDVLGNIKGTYGYIDDSGQIKRVSYSTSNSSEVLTKSEPAASVVQRIPKTNRTHTTKRPSSIYSTTLSTPTSTTALQRIAKLRSSTTTTDRPNYSEVVNVESELSKTTPKPPHIVYPTSTPRILLQGRPIIRSTPPTHTQTQKSEGQLIRPEVVTARPTELPLFRRLALKHQILNEGKPIAEEPEVRSNILRRQLSQEKTSNFDPQQHVFTLQQSLGNDATDVYSASVTTGTPRPLFTTTNRPRALLSTTTSPTVVSRPTIRYPLNYQRNVLQDLEANTPEYAQETTTTQATANEATPTPVPIVQIPANRAPQEPLVAIRHPFQRGTILVPLSQLQGRVLPVDLNEHQPQYVGPNEQYIKETTPKPTPEAEPRPIYVRRLPPPQFRPIPVQVDENGFIREVQRPSNGPVPSYPLPIPVTPAPKYIDNVGDNDIEDISPPTHVETQNFTIQDTDPCIAQPLSPIISNEKQKLNKPVLFSSYPRTIFNPDKDNTSIFRHNTKQQSDNNNAKNRKFITKTDQQQETKEEYLPPDVREMLLLRMLQLAINPALPVAEDEMVQDTTPVPQYKKVPVRNVEILGEEAEEEKRPVRNKRYREPHMDYYE